MYVKLNGLKMRFEIGVSVEYFFQNVRHKVFIEFAQCIVTVNVLTLTDDNEERYIFSYILISNKCGIKSYFPVEERIVTSLIVTSVVLSCFGIILF